MIPDNNQLRTKRELFFLIKGDFMETILEDVASQVGILTRQRGGKYLTFSLVGQEYGIGILKIREIMGMMPITGVPQAPGFVRGVINLRGKVIPIVDLRLKFGLEAAEQTEKTCIIVVSGEGSQGDMLIGLVVDSVSEVINIKENEVEESPTFSTDMNTDFILGMAKINQGIKILLDIDRVLNIAEMEKVTRLS
jgi:purine-binding chemotaxis protein CheW